MFLPAGTEVKPEDVTKSMSFSTKEKKLQNLYTELSIKVQQSNVGIASELVELELARNNQRALQRTLYQIESQNRFNSETRPICLVDASSIEKLLTEAEEQIEQLQDRIAEFNIRTKITIPDELIV